ncbi:MAG: hypothetical protein VKJ64_01375, partial [Leptolyngbyaceae bacterium]|nr:hypothetical protein [Leptolyngbyaceae bacterium]
MTSQSDRIQSLVDQINTILHDASVDGEPMVDEYQVLAQTRQRLIQLQGPSLPPIVAASMETTETAIAVQNWHAPAPALAESAQQVLQSIVQEMAYLRMNTVQPLREEIVRLQQERNYLASEVQQLQHQRYQLVLAQQTDQQQMINGFLHALMERLQEQLALQVAQTIAKLEGRTGTTLVSAGDAKVMQLDSTLQVVFDSLQSNINVHQAALEASLQKMQGLGQQGEAMFTAFVNRLASRLGQEASQYLQPGTPGEPPFNPSAVPGEPSVAGADAFASVSSEDSFYELSDLPLPLDQTTVDFPISPFNQPIVAVHEDGSEETPLAMGGLDSVVDGIMLGETGFDASPAVLGSAAWPDDGITEDWPDPAVDQSLDPLLDQVIDDLESEAIAPLDALEVVDNLDLGFDLEAVELADVPADKTALSALLQESDDASKVFDPDPLSLRDLAQGDTSRNDPRYRIDDSTEDQGNEDQSNEDDGMSPMVLSPPEGLSAPLQPITTLQLDNDDIDVDRLLNVINASADEPGVDLTEPVEAENWTESGPDDVSLLRQELAAELQDELIDEQLFGASETVPLPEDIFPTVDAPPAMSQSDSGISFTINAPRATVEPEGRVDENILDDGEPETWTPGGSESDSPDFYGAFVDSIEPGYFSDSAPEPESELESELESGLGVELGSEAEAEVEEGDRLFMVDEPPVAPPDQPEGATTGGLMRATTGGLPLQDDLPVALEGNHGGIALTSDLLAAEDEPTMAPASDTADGWEFSNSSDPSPPEIGADRTGDAEPPTADDGISDSWSQWIDDAEVSSSTLPELDESDDANLSAWLESDTSEGPTADLSPVADIINRLTDLVQDFPTGGGTGEDDPSAPDDLTAMFEEEDRSVDPLFPVTSMADDSPNDGADDEADDLLMGDRY